MFDVYKGLKIFKKKTFKKNNKTRTKNTEPKNLNLDFWFLFKKECVECFLLIVCWTVSIKNQIDHRININLSFFVIFWAVHKSFFAMKKKHKNPEFLYTFLKKKTPKS